MGIGHDPCPAHCKLLSQSVSFGCLKINSDWVGASTTHIHFSWFWRLGSQIKVLVRTLFPACRQAPPSVSSLFAETERGESCVLVCPPLRVLMPAWGPTSMTSSEPNCLPEAPPPLPPHWGLGSNMWISGGPRASHSTPSPWDPQWAASTQVT